VCCGNTTRPLAYELEVISDPTFLGDSPLHLEFRSRGLRAIRDGDRRMSIEIVESFTKANETAFAGGEEEAAKPVHNKEPRIWRNEACPRQQQEVLETLRRVILLKRQVTVTKSECKIIPTVLHQVGKPTYSLNTATATLNIVSA
jgi:hypothetical protein